MKPPPAGFWWARLRSFRYAWRGIVYLVRTQGNARLHLASTILVVILGFVLHVTRGEWCLLALASGMVWAAEALNSALEYLADHVTMEHHERIGRVKDMAAGGVLLAAIAAAIIGGVVFIPKLLVLVGVRCCAG